MTSILLVGIYIVKSSAFAGFEVLHWWALSLVLCLGLGQDLVPPKHKNFPIYLEIGDNIIY